jgi:transcriptional regulator with XRE-family HTH domain
MDRIALGRRIREARNKLRFTQEVLAEKADIAVTYLGEIERGEKTPSLDVLINIAESLQVSCDYLLRDSVEAGTVYVDADISRKLAGLTRKQRIAAESILDAYIKSL